MLRLEGVGKCFRLYRRPVDRLWEALTRRPRHTPHWALRDVSVTVAAGEFVAFIGRNGAGKSTLMKLATGVLVPDAGYVRREGRVVGLLELGAGFDARLSGRENLRLNAQLLGMSPARVRAAEDSIIAFAELDHCIDEPLRTYSSGMAMRLGFAVLAHTEPECLVVDEALAVGDAAFQQKCWDWLRRYRAEGGAVLLVSHDLATVRQFADRALVLEAGRVDFEGAAADAVAHYLRLIAGSTAGAVAAAGGPGFGDGRAVIGELMLLNDAGQAVRQVACGEWVTLRARVRALADVGGVALGFLLRDRFGQDVFGMNSWQTGRTFDLAAGTSCTLQVRWQAELAVGPYSVTVALHPGAHHVGQCLHWWENALSFEVAGVLGVPFAGVARLPVLGFARIEENEDE